VILFSLELELTSLAGELGINGLSKLHSAEAVKWHQVSLASKFYNLMNDGQTQSRSNGYRQLFYKKVIELAAKVNFHCIHPFLLW
jgi:hypothetical protein